MKKIAHLARTAAKPAPHRAPVARVQTKLRAAGAGNHRRQRNDALERQAEEIAARIMRSETGVARRISSARPAHFHLPGSRGQPLPHPVRERMESAFGADFRAVRVHTGTTADQAASELGAEAFVAGRDIYFRAGAYAPAETQGRALLAHELAHVLQQTGRRTRDGRLAATETRGTGDVQCASLKEEFTSRSLFESTPDLETVISRHLAENPDDTALAEHADFIRTTLNTISVNPTPTEKLVLKAKEKEVAKNLVHRALYFDALKQRGDYPAAMKAVYYTPPTRTAFGRNDFYEKHLKGDLSWMAGTMSSSPVLAKHWKKRFVDTFRIHLFGPGRVEQSLGPDRQFSEVYKEELAKPKEPTALIDSERYFYALAALQKLDEFRIAVLQTNRQQNEKNDATYFRPERRQDFAKTLAAPGTLDELAAAWDLPPESLHLWNLVSDDIVLVAEQAVAFWDRVAAFDTLRRDNAGEFESFGEIRKLLGEVKGLKELKNLERDLLRIAKAAFALPGGKAPTVAAYQAQMKAQAGALTRLATNYDIKLFELARAQLAGDAIDERKFILLGWVQWIVFAIALRMRHFTPSAVPAKPNAAEKRLPQDEMIKHRLQLNRWWFGIANQLGMEELKAFFIEVHLAEQTGQKESQLALFGQWELDPQSGLALMQKEFPKGQINGLEPLTGADLANFSYLLYAQDLANEIWAVLEVDGMAKDFSGNKPPVINQALERIKPFKRPRRHIMRDYVAAVRPSERARFSALLKQHPRFDELHGTMVSGEAYVIPEHYDLHKEAGGVVVWIVPRMDELVTTLADALPELDVLVRAQMEKNRAAYDAAVAKKQKPEPLGEEWYQWLEAFDQVTAQDPAARAKLSETIVGSYHGAVENLAVQSRKATTHERRVLLEQHLRKLWTDYDPSDIATYSKPTKAIEYMVLFAAGVSPPKDEPLQMAALLIELGPLLYARLGPQDVLFGALETEGTERFGLIAGLLPHLAGTAALLGDAAKLKEIKSLDLQVPGGFDQHVEALRKLQKQMEKATFEMQLERKLIVSKEGGSLAAASWSHATYIGPDNAFMVDGVEYEIVEIYESFTYVPAVVMSSGGIDWPESELGDSLLTYADGTVVKKADRKGKPLFKILRNGIEIVVHDNDERMLSEMMHVVSMHAFLQSMAALQDVLETFAEVMLTGMELIPGWGQAVMVTRFVTSALAFIASPEFELIKQACGGDAEKMVQEAIAKIKESFSPDIFWGWVLFGEPELPTFKPREETDKQKKVRERHRKGTAAERLGKLFARLGRITMRLGESVGRLHDKFEYPMRRTQTFVITHPLIGLVIDLVVENFARLENVKLTELELPTDFTPAKISAEVGKLSEKITELLAHVREAKLPEDIIPLDQLIDTVLELVTDKLGGKYKVAVQLIKEGLQKIGAWDKIVAAITDELKSVNMDPNILWRELIRAELEPIFETLCADFADAAGGTLKKVPFLEEVPPPATPDVQFELEAGEFPEVQEWPSDHPSSNRPPLSSWPRSAGAPLSPALARDASRRFGHNFSHVRLHTGSAAANVTRSLGAEGLTSGSHVYLRPGLSPASGHGARVFRHELSHVIQQTGPRPLGGSHPAAPVAGDRGRGVRHDSALEAAADRAAARAEQSAIARAPLDPGSTRVRAPQPKLDRLMKQFFTKVGADDTLVSRKEHINEGKGGPKGLRLNAYGNRVVAELPGALKTAIVDLKKNAASFPGYLAPVHTDVIDYVIDNHWSTINAAMTVLVKRAHEGKPVKSHDSTTGVTKTKTEWTFNPGRLEQEIEEYVFAQTGFLFDLEFELEAATGAGASPTDKRVDLTKPIKTLKVLALHLAYLGGTAALWDKIIDNTWIANKPALPTKFHDKTAFPKQAEAIAAYKLNARLVLRDAGPQPKVFHSSQFRFSDWFAEQVENSIFAVAGGDLPLNALPPWDEYRDPNQTTNNYSTASGHIHLAFGTYGDRTKPKAQWGVGRNAHHITQYLILEYLRNRKSDQKPFKHPLKNYPGVAATGSKVKTIAEPAPGTAKIDVETYEAGRGGLMPTILISEHAHENGGVHVHGKPDDGPGASSPSTPGFAVHNEFRAHLGADYAGIMFDATPNKLQTVDKQTKGQPVPAAQAVTIGGNPVTSDMLQSAIFTAANKTYQWMRDDMAKKLRAALKSEEVHYYETMVRRQMQAAGRTDYATAPLPTGYVPNVAHMNTVADAAVAHNASIMEDATKVGFKK